MGRKMVRRSRWGLMTAATAALACGCGSGPASTPTSPPSSPVSPSVGSPGGALAGFLDAARTQDNTTVALWLPSGADSNDLAELVHVYSGFGSSGGVIWEVGGVKVISATSTGPGAARVTLSGDIVWCLGKAANDPAATCSVVNPVSGLAHTYAAKQVDGRWKADIDINASSGLDHNPQASPTVAAPTATPTST